MSVYDLIFPKNLNCIVCSMPISIENKYSLCCGCSEKIFYINSGCEKCGKPLINSSSEEVYIDDCPYCSNKNFIFDRNISVIEYGYESKKIIFDLKYKRRTFLSKIIAEMMVDGMLKNHGEVLKEIDVITFVPVSKKRLKERGFNQAEKIYTYIRDYLQDKLGDDFLSSIEFIECLDRSVDTKRLSELKSKNRKKELKGAFLLKDGIKDKILNKNILLVDDIFTTGSTADEISKVLKIKGCNKVVVLTFLTGRYEDGSV